MQRHDCQVGRRTLIRHGSSKKIKLNRNSTKVLFYIFFFKASIAKYFSLSRLFHKHLLVLLVKQVFIKILGIKNLRHFHKRTPGNHVLKEPSDQTIILSFRVF